MTAITFKICTSVNAYSLQFTAFTPTDMTPQSMSPMQQNNNAAGSPKTDSPTARWIKNGNGLSAQSSPT